MTHPDIEFANAHGIPADIHLVSCGAVKANHAAEARLLYTSSSFRQAYEFASTRGSLTGEGTAPCFIASALYGLVDPHTVLAPYDATLKEYTPEQHGMWVQLIRAQLREMGVQRANFHAHGGRAYVEALRDAVAPFGRVVNFFNYWNEPKIGREKGIGFRRGWYRRTADSEQAWREAGCPQ